MTAVAPLLGSRRTSMIVSERTGFLSLTSVAAVGAEHEDRLRLARVDVVERALDARDRRALALDDA